jgi:superkiller protein 3
MAEDVIGYERWIQFAPENAALHDDVGVLYLELNRAEDAVRHFNISARMQPGSAAAHFNLGTALTIAGNADRAVAEYQRALQLNPNYARAHNNLGGLLLRIGRVEEARVHLAEALRIDPDNPEAHRNTSAAMQQQGRTAEAIGHLKRAIQLNNDWPAALDDLAWLLAVSDEERLREPQLAVQLAEHAVALTERQDPTALDVLGAAYAAAGDFGRALEAAQAALVLAPENVAAISERRDLYKAERPYRLPAR